MTAFGKAPTWVCPTELVRALAAPVGQEAMLHLELKGALFQPHALVRLYAGRFTAVVGFEDPTWPGRRQDCNVLLAGVPKENAL